MAGDDYKEDLEFGPFVDFDPELDSDKEQYGPKLEWRK